MILSNTFPSPRPQIPNPQTPTKSRIASPDPQNPPPSYHSKATQSNVVKSREAPKIPTMSEIIESSRTQKVGLRLRAAGPFFRVTARSLETEREIGRAEGMVRGAWENFSDYKKILHLDSIRLSRETLGMERSLFGIGLLLGALMIRYGYDSGCTTAELLAINDSHLYHSKLVRFYTRIGFRTVKEVTGGSIGDLGDMLVWGGRGTRMEANIEDLLVKWCARFKFPI